MNRFPRFSQPPFWSKQSQNVQATKHMSALSQVVDCKYSRGILSDVWAGSVHSVDLVLPIWGQGYPVNSWSSVWTCYHLGTHTGQSTLCAFAGITVLALTMSQGLCYCSVPFVIYSTLICYRRPGVLVHPNGDESPDYASPNQPPWPPTPEGLLVFSALLGSLPQVKMREKCRYDLNMIKAEGPGLGQLCYSCFNLFNEHILMYTVYSMIPNMRGCLWGYDGPPATTDSRISREP